ncbi:hypothetical protein G7Z17_g4891 [Cylindrodendrum hubeiense]|uniref:Uncharacterized protein n=1 Tax=Cylindrodendrum hubeiense TaxID=595255 RepID=A0A9P5LGQ8_9HYPO|nr:hypothetical protein G7Z17_g4891 [Cylindrodendrum hubeiense]
MNGLETSMIDGVKLITAQTTRTTPTIEWFNAFDNHLQRQQAPSLSRLNLSAIVKPLYFKGDKKAKKRKSTDADKAQSADPDFPEVYMQSPHVDEPGNDDKEVSINRGSDIVKPVIVVLSKNAKRHHKGIHKQRSGGYAIRCLLSL